jgi:hypothetical protein
VTGFLNDLVQRKFSKRPFKDPGLCVLYRNAFTACTVQILGPEHLSQIFFEAMNVPFFTYIKGRVSLVCHQRSIFLCAYIALKAGNVCRIFSGSEIQT